MKKPARGRLSTCKRCTQSRKRPAIASNDRPANASVPLGRKMPPAIKDRGADQMKVHELVAALGRLDQRLEVYCYIDDKRFATPNRPFWLLSVSEVGIAEGETSRDADGVPTITFRR